MSNLIRRRIAAVICTTLIAGMTATIGCQAVDTANEDEGQTIIIYGASGKIGSLISTEALDRGHRVIGVSRNPNNLSMSIKHDHFTAVKGDVTDLESFTSLTRDVDAIVISVHGNAADNLPENSTHARAAAAAVSVISEMKDAPYVIQIGGATTMHGDKKTMLKNLPFPAEEGSEMYGMLFGHLVALNTYRASVIDWTVITPPRIILGWSPEGITDTKRLGEYRTSTVELIKDVEGNNSIYIADLAAATIDELENRQHVRQRFTIGY